MHICVAGVAAYANHRRRRSRPTRRSSVYSLRLGTWLDITIVVVNSSCCRCRVSRVAVSSFSGVPWSLVWCAAGRRAWAARRLAPVGHSCHATSHHLSERICRLAGAAAGVVESAQGPRWHGHQLQELNEATSVHPDARAVGHAL